MVWVQFFLHEHIRNQMSSVAVVGDDVELLDVLPHGECTGRWGAASAGLKISCGAFGSHLASWPDPSFSHRLPQTPASVTLPQQGLTRSRASGEDHLILSVESPKL